jgi:hypothetical protein
MSDAPAPLSRTDCTAERPLAAHLADTRSADERVFLELRRKVQESGLLSAATERLLHIMKFNGRLTVVVHNGRVFKSAYEEGYFRRKNDLGCG